MSNISTLRTPADTQTPDELSVADEEFLGTLGKCVRELRERRGISRKLLAQQSKVSERYLGQLETGEGNISIILLRRIAAALSVTLAELLIPGEQDSVERRLIRRFFEEMPAHRMEEVIFRLMRDFGHAEAVRRKRVALIGLRGAGKSTLGAMLAKELNVPLIELNREVEREAGLPVSEVIALYGQSGYRRVERKVFERVVGEVDRAVFVAGGGIVADEESFSLLLSKCYTIWLKARPEEHMARVLAQGDLRPMAGNEDAMEDLKRILAAREPSYRRADTVVDTSGDTPAQSLVKLRDAVVA
jgi:XRE family aerobic/anaerobic benzoate catabolism transcriptional regulator